jgi:exosome complex exonuclease DIS3/RRP44
MCNPITLITTRSCTSFSLQLDFLEHPAITDVVVCSVVLEEVRHKNSAAYQRLRALCASDAKRFFVFANEHHRWGACTSLSQNNQNEW